MTPLARMRPVHVVVMAKAPVPGWAKTRLAPALGEAGAARLAAALLHDTHHRVQALQTLAAEAPCVNAPSAISAPSAPSAVSVEWCLTPAPHDPVWGSHLPNGVAALNGVCSDQGAGDLGQRMARPSQRATHLQHAVMLVGTDCPLLSAALMWQAACALQHHDAVLIPATDGGYVLLGLRQHCPELFADMPWSTDAVARLTVSRLQARGWSVWQGPCLPDVDEPADLLHLPPALQNTLEPT